MSSNHSNSLNGAKAASDHNPQENNMSYQHWRLHTDTDHILWLTFDRQGASVNSMSREVFNELDTILDTIKQDQPRGVIIQSGKQKGFIAGADITQFTDLKTTDEAFELIRQAQLVLDKLEALPMPTVAMINGFCLGGGLELALACRYRVVLEDAGTLIGLPEVKLGIHPGWGGTVRLPQLVGAVPAMTMILPGAAYPAKKAQKVGIVDAAVPLRELARAARYYVMHQPAPQQPKLLAKLANLPFVRPILAKQFYKNLNKKIREAHYPAPYAVVRNWVQDGATGDAMVNEAKSIAKLMLHPTARNLVRVFFLQEQVKAIGKGHDFKPQHVHVIGAGTMGGDIAAWCAYKNLYVTLQDQSPEKIAPALQRAYKLYKKKYRGDQRLIQAAMDRLQPDVEGLGVGRADLIIEAVFEDLNVKQQLFKYLEENAKADAVLATNTSSIPLEDIATALKDPSRLVGIHFFNPVAKMPLVEIVQGQKTKQAIVDQAAAFVGKISRMPLPVASRPGFLVNRVLMPYLMEAMQLLDEGIAPASIDKAALDFGMPMGPIALADNVGLDICLSVANNLVQQFGGEVPQKLKDIVTAGHLGVKTGQGFYQYQNGRPVKTTATNDQTDLAIISDRLILRMLNEAVACLDEKVIQEADLLDAGMIFGTGFAPFRGGPIHYAKHRGIDEVVKTLQAFAEKFGERFKPHSAWQTLSGSVKSATKVASAPPAHANDKTHVSHAGDNRG